MEGDLPMACFNQKVGEQLERLCPDCRVRAEQARCPVCGRPEDAGQPGEGGSNPAFDLERYRRLKEGGE